MLAKDKKWNKKNIIVKEPFVVEVINGSRCGEDSYIYIYSDDDLGGIPYLYGAYFEKQYPELKELNSGADKIKLLHDKGVVNVFDTVSDDERLVILGGVKEANLSIAKDWIIPYTAESELSLMLELVAEYSRKSDSNPLKADLLDGFREFLTDNNFSEKLAEELEEVAFDNYKEMLLTIVKENAPLNEGNDLLTILKSID